MNLIKKYRCNGCMELRATPDDAEACCDRGVESFYVCGECESSYIWFLKDEAEECCKLDGLHDFLDLVPRCLCGARASDEDLHDSRLLGTLIRCRAHILAAAPEMLAAETIAHGRAA